MSALWAEGSRDELTVWEKFPEEAQASETNPQSFHAHLDPEEDPQTQKLPSEPWLDPHPGALKHGRTLSQDIPSGASGSMARLLLRDLHQTQLPTPTSSRTFPASNYAQVYAQGPLQNIPPATDDRYREQTESGTHGVPLS